MTLPRIDWAKHGGLVPCIAQDVRTGRVLMLAWMDEAALQRTLETGRMHYYSRSRQRLWMKGEESGHTQTLVALDVDCDADALLAVVEQVGPACHTGNGTCWFTPVVSGARPVLEELWRTIEDRRAHPKEGSWTNRLLADPALAVAKVREEADEVVRAAGGDPREDDLPHEAADLLYHLMVLVAARGHSWDEVLERLRARQAPQERGKR